MAAHIGARRRLEVVVNEGDGLPAVRAFWLLVTIGTLIKPRAMAVAEDAHSLRLTQHVVIARLTLLSS